MTIEQTTEVLTYVKAACPMWAKDLKANDAKSMIMVWSRQLKDYDYELVMASVESIVRTSKWVPSISEVVEKCELIASGGKREMTEGEAWSLVLEASRNSTYNAKQEFDKLPPVIQTVLRTPETLRSYASATDESSVSVNASNFMRSFRVALKNKIEYDMLPSIAKKMLESNKAKLLTDGLAQKMLMDKE